MAEYLTFETAAQALQTYDRPFVLTKPNEQGSRYWHRARLLSLRNRSTAIIKPDGHGKNEEVPIEYLKLKVSGNEALRRKPNGMTVGGELRATVSMDAMGKVADSSEIFDVDEHEAKHLVSAVARDLYAKEREKLDPDHWLLVDVTNRNALLDGAHFMPLFEVLRRIESGVTKAYATRGDAERAMARALKDHPDWDFDRNALVVMDLEAAMETATMPDPQPEPAKPESPPVVQVPPENIPVLEAIASAREVLASVDTPDGGKLELTKSNGHPGEHNELPELTAAPRQKRKYTRREVKAADADTTLAEEMAEEIADGVVGAAKRLAKAKVAHELAQSKLKEAEVELEAAKRFMTSALKEAGM